MLERHMTYSDLLENIKQKAGLSLSLLASVEKDFTDTSPESTESVAAVTRFISSTILVYVYATDGNNYIWREHIKRLYGDKTKKGSPEKDGEQRFRVYHETLDRIYHDLNTTHGKRNSDRLSSEPDLSQMTGLISHLTSQIEHMFDLLDCGIDPRILADLSLNIIPIYSVVTDDWDFYTTYYEHLHDIFSTEAVYGSSDFSGTADWIATAFKKMDLAVKPLYDAYF